ncbi:MAG: glycosyltransferase family 4 protein [Lentimicrobium sp.]|jgi:glycosyltransferase involved in cell wall biosynthesis|nr:glycosyltransferase family 4 protein [Lentimicrobium sp.]
MKISIFNGVGTLDYLLGLVSGLSQVKEDDIDVLDSFERIKVFAPFNNVNYFPVFSVKYSKSTGIKKAWNILRFYYLQVFYLLSRKPRIIHFQWLERHKIIDRIVIPLIAKVRGHKTVLTVHNVNAGKRDNRNTWFNTLTLRLLYKLCNQLIVHTEKSKEELQADFKLPGSKISVIKHGMNIRVNQAGLTREEARNILEINQEERVVLFFGNIDHYKGLDVLIESLNLLPLDFADNFRLIIAGKIKSSEYKKLIDEIINRSRLKHRITSKMSFIHDKDVEAYFVASDCAALPYREIYQSGIIFMAYAFGLPVLVSDVGNFRQDVPDGKSGFIVSENSPQAWSLMIQRYFSSELCINLPESRDKIKTWAKSNYSWDEIGKETRKVYESMLQE